MNSTKKGPCYGFRLQSLDSLSITKSSDKKQTLVHYLANLVNSKYPELKGFESELKYIDKAAQFSLENILTDVRELEKGKKFLIFCQKLAQSVFGTLSYERIILKGFDSGQLNFFFKNILTST